MDKIYSRKRIRIKTKYKILFTIILIVGSIIILLNQVIYPLFSKKCIYKAKVLVTQISNQETEKIMENYTYKDLVHIEEDTEGNVTFLESNVVAINQIKSSIVNRIQNRFLEMKSATIGIKAGALTGSRLFSNIGPKIEIQVIPSGTINSSLETEFYAVGVNQSIHRIYLDITCSVNILSPFESVSQSMENKILLSESVIVGNTPENYYKIDGIDSMTSQDQLNFID